MKKITPTISLVLILLISATSFAQTQEEMQKWMAYATPGEMHKMLEKSNGTWNEDLTMWMAPAAPPQKMTATCENKMILDGRYQVSTHTGNYNNMPFEGHGLVAYDNARKVFQSVWIDNMGTGVINMEGTYDPATKMVTLKGKETDPATGNVRDIRQTVKFVDDNTQIVEMYSTQNGQEFKTMEIKLTRKS